MHLSCLSGSAPHLPQNWQAIGIGDLVVANQSREDGWYEAIVVEARLVQPLAVKAASQLQLQVLPSNDPKIADLTRDWPCATGFVRPRQPRQMNGTNVRPVAWTRPTGS
jgi:hypothetical protein